ncbi:MAG TPA: DUF1877 family protein [Kofleriaceae bacterium]|jgi:hypothetical protein
MSVICTLFSVTDADVSAPSELTLPAMDHTSKVGATREPHIIELGGAWTVLHEAFGAHPAENPLGFLVAGGASYKPLFDGQGSSGRHFTPSETVKLLAAVARVTDESIVRNVATKQITALSVGELLRKLTKLRVFLAEAVAQDRGIIVHHLR